MKRLVMLMTTLLAAAPVAAADGYLEWTEASFCNGAGYCVAMKAKESKGLSVLKVTHHGRAIEFPADAVTMGDKDAPALSRVRLYSTEYADGKHGNTLEIPFLLSRGNGTTVSYVRLSFDADDKFIGSTTCPAASGDALEITADLPTACR